MGYWGWRRLLTIFVSVWVVGCSATPYSAPAVSPTPQPHITLTVRSPYLPTPPPAVAAAPAADQPASPTPVAYAVQPGDTLSGIARQFGVPLAALESANPGMDPLRLPIGQTLIIPNPVFDAAGRPSLPTATPVLLALASPVCQEMPTDRVICIGAVTNPQERPVERVAVRVRLLRADGTVLAESLAGVEQGIIPPGESAPYRALLQADWREAAGTAVDVRSAERAADVVALVAVEEERGRWEAGQYVVSAQLRNPGRGMVRVRRAVVTLWDTAGRLAGYRVIEPEATLAAGEQTPLEVAVLPYLSTPVAGYRLYVEAQGA